MSVDQDVVRHQEIYRGFTRFLVWLSAAVVVVIAILAFVTL
jgi:hypothetical protein